MKDFAGGVTANMRIQGVPDDMAELLRSDQQSVDGVERSLWVGLGDLAYGLDQDPAELRERARIEILLMELAAELEQPGPCLAEASRNRIVDLVDCGCAGD